MINKEKISVYKKYGGDPDAWARIATSQEKSVMSDDDWYLIDSLVQDVIISGNNLDKRLTDNTDSEEVRNEIRNIAKEASH